MTVTSTRADVIKLAIQRALLRQSPKAAAGPFIDYLRGCWIQNANTRRTVRFELWPYLVNAAGAWDRGDSTITLKARQLGYTWLAAAYAVHIGRQDNARVLVLSQSGAYSKAFLERVKFVNAHHDAGAVATTSDNTERIVFAGGGEVMALPSTPNAGRGYNASVVIVDEAAFHPWAAQNAEAYMGTIADDGGQVIVMSTSAGAAGWFYDMYTGADSDPELAMLPLFVPWHERPGRDLEWYERQKRRLGEAAVKREYPATPEEAFTQATGLVFPQFTIDRHIDPEPVPWAACLYRWAGYDLGGGDPSAAVALGIYEANDPKWGKVLKAHVYDLFYKTDGAPTVPEIAEFFGPWETKAPMTFIEGDPAPGGETVMASLRAVLASPVRPANNRRGEGLSTLALFLDNDWLTISPHCEPFLREFASYRWLTRVDPQSKDRFATSTPYDHHGDAIDALRYALMGAYVDIWNRPDAEEQPVAYAEVRW